MLGIHELVDLRDGMGLLKQRGHGVIETRDERLRRIVVRPWPKLLSWPEIWAVPRQYHQRGPENRCRLYFNQPRRYPDFLVLKYVASTRKTTYRTIREALRVLDVIAAIKQSDAILCDVANWRISTRLLKRLGWESHKPQRWHRNYIKRLYGEYAAEALHLLTCTQWHGSDLEPVRMRSERGGQARDTICATDLHKLSQSPTVFG